MAKKTKAAAQAASPSTNNKPSKANVAEWSRVLSEVFLAVDESTRTPLMLKKWNNGIKSAIAAGIAELLVSGPRSEAAEVYNTLIERIASHDVKRMSTWAGA